MKILCRRNYLEQESFGFGGEERLSHILKEGLKIVFEEIHDKIYAVKRLQNKWLMTSGIGAFQGGIFLLADLLLQSISHDHLAQVDYVNVSRRHQRLYFAEACDREAIVRVLHLQSFKSYNLTCGLISSP